MNFIYFIKVRYDFLTKRDLSLLECLCSCNLFVSRKLITLKHLVSYKPYKHFSANFDTHLHL